MAATPGSNLPPFSYAQAAKGRVTSTPTAQSQTEPSLNGQKPLLTEKKPLPSDSNGFDQSHESAPATVTPEAPKDLTEKELREETDQQPKNNSSEENHTSFSPNQPTAAKSETDQLVEKSSPQAADSITVSVQEESLPAVSNGLAESWDKQSETSTVVDKAIPSSENGNEKPAEEDDWAIASDSKSEQEFKAAPIPTVNIWQQRKEAQEAKMKATASSRSSTIINAPVRSKPPAQTFRAAETDNPEAAVKRRPSGRAGEKGDLSIKKKNDDTKARDDSKRGSRQSRAADSAEKDITETSAAPPPVEDATLWPTPETANHEDRKKPYALDKMDKTDAKSPGVKPNQKWVPVPYTPTPKFTTPLPPTLSRRGGRPTRGHRDGGRGGHISQGSVGDRSDRTKVTGAPSISKQTTEQQRGRNQESAAGDRATSAPTELRRAVSVGPSFDGTRRPVPGALSGNRKQPVGEAQVLPFESSSTGNQEGMPSFRTRADSKSFSRQSSNPYRGASYDNGRHSGAESHSHPRHFSGTERRSTYGESDKNGEAAARRDWNDFSKDGGKSRETELKSESWRDRDLTGERPEPRNGRGRGGYRGRGGNHTNYNASPATPTHAFTAPLPQQPFPGGKPHGYGDRHRQQSVPFSGMPSQGSHRGTPRSQSMANHGIFPGMQNSFGPSLAPIQTEFQGMYSGYSPIYPGIMTAVPYNNAIEPNALISMVTAQLDYYFSIENLCKDMYLRSNMDSRGWVPLSVIAGFNRIKSLTEDTNLIRYVCQVSRNIEYRPGDDGNDRIRKLEKWEHWILDMDQRQSHAQNDGPSPLPRSQSPAHINQGFPAMPHVTSPTWSQAPYYDTYADVPAFTPRNFPPEDQGIASPIHNHLPEIPSGETFSLTNGQLEAMNQSAGGHILAGHIPEVEVTSQDPQPAFASPASRPSPSSARSITPALNGTASANHQEIGAENVFSNDRINELHICVRHVAQQQQPSFLLPSNRSFSHGSIDGPNLGATALNASLAPLRGGSGSPERTGSAHDRSISAESSSSVTDRGVFWMKDGAPPDGWNQGGSTVEKYQSLYDRAMSERIPGDISNDLDWLYQFWSHFLVRNFNHDMYNDFRSLAIEDGTAGDDKGLSHLSQYYGAVLSGSQVLSAKLADDITKIAGAEYDTKRHIFQRLRSAWRNGAFNFKSRKLIDKSLSAELRAELEK